VPARAAFLSVLPFATFPPSVSHQLPVWPGCAAPRRRPAAAGGPWTIERGCRVHGTVPADGQHSLIPDAAGHLTWSMVHGLRAWHDGLAWHYETVDPADFRPALAVPPGAAAPAMHRLLRRPHTPNQANIHRRHSPADRYGHP
jgi:hypothetical protein